MVSRPSRRFPEKLQVRGAGISSWNILTRPSLQVAAGATGLIRACLDASVKYASARKTFGVPIAKHGNRNMSSKSGAADVLSSGGSLILEIGAPQHEEARRKFVAFPAYSLGDTIYDGSRHPRVLRAKLN